MALNKKRVRETKAINNLDYKDVEFLRDYISERGKVLPRRITGINTKFQKKIKVLIKRARYMALLPFVASE